MTRVRLGSIGLTAIAILTAGCGDRGSQTPTQQSAQPSSQSQTAKQQLADEITEATRTPNPGIAESLPDGTTSDSPHEKWELDYVLTGWDKVRNGQFKEALTYFTAAVQKKQRLNLAYFSIGYVKNKLGDSDGALVAYDKAIELDPDMNSSHLNRGQIRLRKADVKGALVDFDAELRIKPTFNAYLCRAKARGLLGDTKGAYADLELARQLKPNHPAADWEEALITEESGGPPEYAIAILNRALKLMPNGEVDFTDRVKKKINELQVRADAGQGGNWVQDFYRTGVESLHRGEWDEGIAYCAEAVKRKQDLARAYACMGYGKMQKGDLDGALSDYTSAISLDPATEMALVNRGIIKAMRNDMTGALADFDASIATKPSYEGYLNRGRLKGLQRSTYSDAIGDLMTAKELKPKDPGAYLTMADVYARMGIGEVALSLVNDALRLIPRDDVAKLAEAYDLRSGIRKVYGDPTGAAEDARVAAELNGEIPKAKPLNREIEK